MLAADSDIGRMRLDGEEDDRGNSRRRELRRRDFAPSERLSADLCRARPRRRGVGKPGADPRGDQRRASARRGLASACVRHVAIPGFPAVGGRRRAAVLPAFRSAAIRQCVSRLQREAGSRACDLPRPLGFPAQRHEFDSRRAGLPAVRRPSPVSSAGGARRRHRRGLPPSACSPGAWITAGRRSFAATLACFSRAG